MAETAPQLVTVHWLDATTDNAWQSIGQAKAAKPVPCATTGYLLRRDRVAIVVAGSINPEADEVNAVTVIPRGMVTAVRKLRERRNWMKDG